MTLRKPNREPPFFSFLAVVDGAGDGLFVELAESDRFEYNDGRVDVEKRGVVDTVDDVVGEDGSFVASEVLSVLGPCL